MIDLNVVMLNKRIHNLQQEQTISKDPKTYSVEFDSRSKDQFVSNLNFVHIGITS